MRLSVCLGIYVCLRARVRTWMCVYLSVHAFNVCARTVTFAVQCEYVLQRLYGIVCRTHGNVSLSVFWHTKQTEFLFRLAPATHHCTSPPTDERNWTLIDPQRWPALLFSSSLDCFCVSQASWLNAHNLFGWPIQVCQELIYWIV